MPPTQHAGSWTVGELLRAQARRVPERIALDDGERRLSYRSLDARANRLAHLLAGLGVARGTRVAILSENRSEYLEATYACAKLGAILCALNWRLAAKELAHCVNLVEPAVVLVSPRFEAAYRALGRDEGTIIVLGPDYEDRIAAAPVAFVALHGEGGASAEELLQVCRADLSSYKLPKEIRFVSQADFPRSTSGKVQRQLVERWLDEAARP